MVGTDHHNYSRIGDHFPATPIGRLVAGGLMIGGVAVLGVVTHVRRVLADRSRGARDGGRRRSE